MEKKKSKAKFVMPESKWKIGDRVEMNTGEKGEIVEIDTKGKNRCVTLKNRSRWLENRVKNKIGE